MKKIKVFIDPDTDSFDYEKRIDKNAIKIKNLIIFAIENGVPPIVGDELDVDEKGNMYGFRVKITSRYFTVNKFHTSVSFTVHPIPS